MQTNSFSVIYGIYIHKAEQEEGFPAPPLRLSAATGPYQTRNFSVQRYLWLGKLRSCCASVRAESRWGGNSQGQYFCSLRKSIIFACKKKRDADARC